MFASPNAGKSIYTWHIIAMASPVNPSVTPGDMYSRVVENNISVSHHNETSRAML